MKACSAASRIKSKSMLWNKRLCSFIPPRVPDPTSTLLLRSAFCVVQCSAFTGGFVPFGATLLFLQTLFSTEKPLSLLENLKPSSSFKYDLFCLLLLPPEGLWKPADLCEEGMGRGKGKEEKKKKTEKIQKCEKEKDFLEKWNLGKYPVFTCTHAEFNSGN